MGLPLRCTPRLVSMAGPSVRKFALPATIGFGLRCEVAQVSAAPLTSAHFDTRIDTRFSPGWSDPPWDVKSPNRQHWRGFAGRGGMQ